MTSRPSSLTTLRLFVANSPGAKDLRKLLQNIFNDPNHRGAALSAAALLDTAIEDSIASKLRPAITSDEEERNLLFGSRAPLGSFSSKIRMGFALGLYGCKTRDDLDMIREVRNAFAHSRHEISFGTKELIPVCKRITIMERFWALKFQDGPPWNSDDIHNTYISSCTISILYFRQDLKDDAIAEVSKIMLD